MVMLYVPPTQVKTSNLTQSYFLRRRANFILVLKIKTIGSKLVIYTQNHDREHRIIWGRRNLKSNRYFFVENIMSFTVYLDILQNSNVNMVLGYANDGRGSFFVLIGCCCFVQSLISEQNLWDIWKLNTFLQSQ